MVMERVLFSVQTVTLSKWLTKSASSKGWAIQGQGDRVSPLSPTKMAFPLLHTGSIAGHRRGQLTFGPASVMVSIGWRQTARKRRAKE